MIPTDQQLRDLLDTYKHCRKFAHAGEVGANAVTLIAALDELLERRSYDISQHVAGAAENMQGQQQITRKDDLGVLPARWASAVSSTDEQPQKGATDLVASIGKGELRRVVDVAAARGISITGKSAVRWTTHGKYGIRLPAFRIGGARCTTEAAFDAWLQAIVAKQTAKLAT